MDWFICDRVLRHERVKECLIKEKKTQMQKYMSIIVTEVPFLYFQQITLLISTQIL